MSPDPTPVRSTRDPRRAADWGLVLTAHGIPFEIVERGGTWEVWTAAHERDRAARELASYDEENVPPPPRPEVPHWGRTWTGFWAAWVLLALFVPLSGSPVLLDRGSAKAERILAGEPWRAVTALLLHADLPHVVANAAATGVFLSFAAWRLGPGAALALSLAGGTAGNLLAAWLTAKRHDSIGASTATFAMLGVITAAALADARRFGVRRRAPWVLLGASLALLGYLGSAEDSDVIAHATGWACGLAVALAFCARRVEPLPRAAQHALVALTAGVLAGAWALAR